MYFTLHANNTRLSTQQCKILLNAALFSLENVDISLIRNLAKQLFNRPRIRNPVRNSFYQQGGTAIRIYEWNLQGKLEGRFQTYFPDPQ